MMGIANYCDTRLRRWSVKNEKGEVGRRARHIIDSELADDSDYWDQHLSHADSLDSLDAERIDALLVARGLSDEDIDLIKRNLSGWSFVDLAAELGGTADKYRRRIQRALDKADIDPDLLG
jgi:DNA-directed RNA polymerase specialized sigma24 family protein